MSCLRVDSSLEKKKLFILKKNFKKNQIPIQLLTTNLSDNLVEPATCIREKIVDGMICGSQLVASTIVSNEQTYLMVTWLVLSIH